MSHGHFEIHLPTRCFRVSGCDIFFRTGHSWAKTPVDRFILTGLEARSLSPAAPAEKRALLRRVTCDLTGLPPSPEEVEAFLTTDSPYAWSRVVDRLLASPRYGERWGRHWLDLVRYTDDFDEAWRYRDWVVGAFNRDLPYDRFILQQIAGDCVPLSSSLPAQDRSRTTEAEDEPKRGVNAEGIVATTLLSLGPWGATDEFGWNVVESKVHVHDLHATILHLLGLDHERLTYHYGGRNHRLTDVYGRV